MILRLYEWVLMILNIYSYNRSFLRKFEFDYLVVDEGHTLKVSHWPQTVSR